MKTLFYRILDRCERPDCETTPGDVCVLIACAVALIVYAIGEMLRLHTSSFHTRFLSLHARN